MASHQMVSYQTMSHQMVSHQMVSHKILKKNNLKNITKKFPIETKVSITIYDLIKLILIFSLHKTDRGLDT